MQNALNPEQSPLKMMQPASSPNLVTQPDIDAKGGGNLAESSTGPAVNSTILPSSVAKFNDIEENHSKSDKDIHGYA